jgi:hypothetical protein
MSVISKFMSFSMFLGLIDKELGIFNSETRFISESLGIKSSDIMFMPPHIGILSIYSFSIDPFKNTFILWL